MSTHKWTGLIVTYKSGRVERLTIKDDKARRRTIEKLRGLETVLNVEERA